MCSCPTHTHIYDCWSLLTDENEDDVVWKDQIFRLLCTPKISTETTQGSDMQRGGGDKYSSLHIRDGITLYSHQWAMSHGLWKSLIYSGINIFIRPTATLPLNYILMLDRGVEAIDESRQIIHRSPISFFPFIIHSRLVVTDLTATTYLSSLTISYFSSVFS